MLCGGCGQADGILYGPIPKKVKCNISHKFMFMTDMCPLCPALRAHGHCAFPGCYDPHAGQLIYCAEETRIEYNSTDIKGE